MKNQNLNYVAPNTLAQEISENISGRIIQGNLKDGHQLKVLALADEYQTSQTTIRDALQILERSYMAKYIPRRGWFVVSISKDKIDEIWEIKKRLWGYAFRLFCMKNHDNPALISEYCEYTTRYIRAAENGQMEEAFQNNHIMADFVLQNCGNEQLRRMLTDIENMVKRIRRQGFHLSHATPEPIRITKLCMEDVLNNQPLLLEKHNEEYVEYDRQVLLSNLSKL